MLGIKYKHSIYFYKWLCNLFKKNKPREAGE